MTEKEKAESIAKLIGKARKKAPRRSVRVVVARGANRGIQGRPKVSIVLSFRFFWRCLFGNFLLRLQLGLFPVSSRLSL